MEDGKELVYYSEVPKATRGNRVMTDVERNVFDTYKLTLVTYRDITENQARIIFNRLQNAAPMAMADIINSYESELVEFFRNTVRPKLLKGNESYKHIKGVPLKQPDTNEDIYQFLSWFTIINPDGTDEDPKKNALKHIEMGKGRNNNMCFKFLRDFDTRELTRSMEDSFITNVESLFQFVSRDLNCLKVVLK